MMDRDPHHAKRHRAVELLYSLVGEAVGEFLAWLLAPLWRAFVRMLNGPLLVVLWGGAAVAMAATWRVMTIDASGRALFIGALTFIAAPAFALVATTEWRDKRRNDPRWRSLRSY
jgi:hypothetical protein